MAQLEAMNAGDVTQEGGFGQTGPASNDQTFLTLKVHGGGAHTGLVPEGLDDLHTHMLDAAPKARLNEEELLQREVTRRREAELERRQRIFDAKRRTIGVDKDFLDKQCAENEERRRKQKEQEAIEDRHFMGINKLLQMTENECRKARFDTEKAAKDFSLTHLSFEKRREFDLNDPKAVIKDTAARLGDDDPRCGPASLQQFNGEDLLKHERERQQKLAMVHALEQQIFEKKMLRKLNGDGDPEIAAQNRELVRLQNEIEANDAAYKRDVLGQYQEGLKQAMLENNERKHAEAMYNQDLNQQELDFHGRDEFLNETRANRRPDGKLSKDSYKGSTREERVQVFADQISQCQDNAANRAHEGMTDAALNRQAEFTRKQLVMMEREKQRMKRAMAMEIASHNQSMLAQQKETATQLGRDAHRNKITPDFFEQFGTGTR
mmetsp:Transcript_1708/g.3757  ORF Transcript_1708/g.3757 Transcript_1708/m.3757 type:complete len:436 (+) Transcript_1708:79-1386(+)